MYSYPAPAGAPVPLGYAPPRNKKSRKALWWILGLVLVVLVAGAGLTAWRLLSSSTAAASDGSDEAARQLSAAMDDGELSGSEWDEIDADAMFLASVKEASQQRVVNTLRWEGDDLAEIEEAYNIYNITFDWASKEIAYEYQGHSVYPGGEVLGYHRCVDGVMYDRVDHYDSGQGEWEESTVPDASQECSDLTRSGVGTTDHLNTGGMSAEQADTFVSGIAERDMIEVKADEVVEVNGEQYVSVAVELTPVLADHDGQYYGIQQLMWAFQETGLDAADHPYTTVGAGKHGLRMRMYIDPATALPAYSQAINTPGLTSRGSWEAEDPRGEHAIKVQYSYVDEVPRQDLENDEVHEFDWEEEDFPPTTQKWQP